MTDQQLLALIVFGAIVLILALFLRPGGRSSHYTDGGSEGGGGSGGFWGGDSGEGGGDGGGD